jgi:hypothetical protein
MDSNFENCSICKINPEDILMVECGHDLCVRCASYVYKKLHE